MSRRLLLLRRWVLPGISRQSAANRLTTTTTTTRRSSSPWLMMEPGQTECGTAFRFWCCAKKREHKYEYEIWNWKRNIGRPGVTEGLGFLQGKKNLPAAKLVGSSQGWLAYRFKRRLYLVDPTTYRCIRLPDFERDMKVTRLVLSPRTHDDDDDDERELLGHKAFMICGVGSLAFCSRSHQQGGEWSFFSSDADQQYESVVYSTIDRRLLCLTRMMKLEAWDVQGESPRLDWSVHLNYHYHSHTHTQLQKQELELELGCVRYLACAEHTGDLFVVLRFFQKTIQYHVDADADADADDEDEEYVYKYEYEYRYEATHRYMDIGWYPIDPTVHFEVYKIDRQGGSMMKMEDSLDGMSIFVGMNDSMALKIPQEENEMRYIVPMSPEKKERRILAGFNTQEERIEILKEMKMKIKMKNNMKVMRVIYGHEDEDEDEDEFEDDDEVEEEEEEEAIRQDCVHFTYDDRIGRNKYIGKFDLKRREVEPLSFPCFQEGFFPAEEDIDVAYPLWFTPSAASPQGTLAFTDFPAAPDYVPCDSLFSFYMMQ